MSLDLFSQVAQSQERMEKGIRKAVSKHEDDLLRLAPLFRKMMEEKKEFGCTVGEFRYYAAKAGHLPSKGEGRELSYLKVLPARAGGVKNGLRRMSPLPGSRNIGDAYSLPQYVKGAAA